MRSLWAAAMLLRRIRSERGAILLVAALVAATSFVFAAGPRLFNRAADAGLRTAVAAVSPVQRDVTIRVESRLSAGSGGGVTRVVDFGDRLAAGIPASVSALVADRRLLVTTVRLLVLDPPSYETHLSLRYQDGLEAVTTLVAGRWPVDRGVPLRTVPLVDDPDAPINPGAPAVVEVAFAEEQAAEIGVKVGDLLAVRLDASDPYLRRTTYRLAPATVEVVGLFSPIDDRDPYWEASTSLLVAEQRGEPDNPVAFATAYVAAEAYPNLSANELPFHYEWRYQVDPQRIDADQVAMLQADLPRLDRMSGPITPGSSDTILVTSGLGVVLERFANERALAESVLSIAVLGPFGLATGAMAMVAILLVRRRAAALELARGRGASGPLLLGTQLWEAIIVAGGASLAGLAIAVTLVPARASAQSALLAIAVAVTATGLLVGASWRAARGQPGQPQRDDAPILRVAPRRLVIEGTIVALAIAATLLLRQRGLSIDADGTVSADPLLASVPILGGLAAGIVALRLYPVPIRALGWLAARRRDLVPVLGLRTIGRRSGAANLPLLALLLTAAFGTFASIVSSSLARAEEVASYLEVGGDYRLERISSSSFTTLDPTSIVGIGAAAEGFVDATADFSATPQQRTSIQLVAIDALPYQAVTAGTPADPRWPLPFLDEPDPAGLGTDANPIPAILSIRLPGGTVDLAPGATFEMVVNGRPMTFRIVERRATFPGIDARRAFVVAPLTLVRAASENGRLAASRLWVRGPAEAAQPLAAALAESTGSARVISRHDAFALLRDAPMGQILVAGYAVAVVVAALYLALTVIGALVLSAARRTRDLAYLRTLGVSGTQSLSLTVVEHAPPVVLALAPGIGLGIGIAVLTQGSLGLGHFAGTAGAVPLFVDVPSLVLLAVGLLGVVAFAVAAGTWLSRRARMVNALRMGDD
jgi:putative ABC transport system permease protein